MAVDINATRRQRAWDSISDGASRTWRRRVRGADYSLQITDPQIRSLHGGLVFSVDVLVTRNGQPVYDDRINSPNPPLGVVAADGTVSESPLQAFREHIVDVVRAATSDFTKPHLMRDEEGELKGDTLAVRSTTADGKVTSTSTGGTWSAARGGATLAARSATNPETIVASVSGSDYIASQFFMDFDTSSLGSGATLSNGVFTVYGSGTAETNTNSYDIQIRPYNFGGSVTTADWVDCNPTTGWTNPTLMGHLALGSWNQTSGTANNFTVDSYADVSKTASTYVVMGLSGLGSTTSPTGANSLEFRTADQTGTSTDPLLTVTYTPGVSGTIAATLQKALFSGSGSQSQTGTIAATLQKATAALTGEQIYTGSAAMTMQAATFSGAGSQGDGTEGAVASTMQPATASLTGAMEPSGTVVSTMQAPTFSGSGEQSQTGAIAAELQEPTFAGSGEQVLTGAMAGTLQSALFSGVGQQIYTGSLAATMQVATAAMVGVMQPSGVIAVTMQKATFTGAGVHQQIGAIASALQAATFAGAGVQINTGTIAGTLRYLTFEGIDVLAMPGFAIVLDSYADGMRLLDQYADGITLTDAYADGMKLFDLAADGITVDDAYSNGMRLYDGRQ